MHVTTAVVAISAAAYTDGASGTTTTDTCRPGTIEAFLADYPLQKTNDFLLERTKGDPAHVNVWFFESGHLVKAGEDKVVRMNNDTFYKGGYADNRVGPVIVRIENPKKDRFVSLMVQDQRDFNVASIVDADGTYALVKDGQTPPVGAKPIRVTDDFHLCAIRVEVRNEADAPAALAVYGTATIEGTSGGPLPKLDLLSTYRPEVKARALEMMEHWSKTAPTVSWFFGRPEERGIRVSDLDRATGVLYYEGGPLSEHSSYATYFTDASGATLRGDKGTYVLTMTAPPVDAFWSVTVYDTERGGYLHPNPLNRYSINNTGVIPNADGTYTFIFKQNCTESDKNCIPVPAGAFDVVGRFYRPRAEVLQGKWQMPKPTLQR
jgi:hypothetical protein